jgi:hypothetical protein
MEGSFGVAAMILGILGIARSGINSSQEKLQGYIRVSPRQCPFR